MPGAAQKTGHITQDETWSGTIHITGDVQVDAGVTLVIEPGTVVLIAARQDDQHAGHQGSIDEFNPKDPPMDGTQRVEFQVQGNLFVRGTAEAPVIITSDAASPQNDDWRGILIGEPGSTGQITRAIIEFFRSIGIGGSPDIVIRQSILRNMMECVVIGSTGPETDPQTALDLTPTLTQNYIYNTGRSAITVLSGAPTISHNVVRARPDMDTTGFEHGAFSTNWPTCAIIHHNYFDGGQPRPYDGEVGGEIERQYFEFTEPHGVGLVGVCPFTFEFNTVTASPMAMASHMGPGSLQHNNIIAVAASGAYAQSPYGRHWLRPKTCIFAYDGRPQPGDQDWAFLERMGAVPLPVVQVLSAPNNYWGTGNAREIEGCLKTGATGLRIEYRPFAAEFIAEALPNWREFPW